MACLTGRSAEAARHYDDAIALCERMGALPFIELARRARDRLSESSAELRNSP
jgi:hypothetical protein